MNSLIGLKASCFVLHFILDLKEQSGLSFSLSPLKEPKQILICIDIFSLTILFVLKGGILRLILFMGRDHSLSLTPGANVQRSILFPLTEACRLFQKLPNCVHLSGMVKQKKNVGEGLLDCMIYFDFFIRFDE